MTKIWSWLEQTVGRPMDSLQCLAPGRIRRFIAQKQSFGTTDGALFYNAASRVVATTAVRLFKMVRRAFCGDFGLLTTESAKQQTLKAFVALG